MTHIEQLHLEAIQKDKEIRKYLCENDFGTSKLEIIVAKKSAKITRSIAIDFAEWLIGIKSSIAYNDETCLRLYKKSTKDLFQQYLKTK
jgi:hypothetical protein